MLFTNIKIEIEYVPSLRSPNFNEYYLLYTFYSDNSLATMLTQKEEGGDEFPISFMRTCMQGSELNYHNIDKKYYPVFKLVK